MSKTKLRRKVQYTHEEVLRAYNTWVNAKPPRQAEWYAYCDARDGDPIGTNERLQTYGEEKPMMDKETYMKIMGYMQ